MSVGAAIRIDSPDEARVIEHAVTFAQRHGVACYVISIVANMHAAGGDAAVVRQNLNRIQQLHAVPIVQEGDDVPAALIAVARAFGIRTLFLGNGESRSVPKQLLNRDPPFDVVVISSE